METLVWRSEYDIGEAIIDRQHHELFKRVNDFLMACDAGLEPGVLWELFRYLEDYTVVHFMTEERIQRDSGYPDYEEHIKMHGGFIDILTRLRHRFEADGPTPGMLREMQAFVTRWIVDHVTVEDRALGKHLRENPQDRRKSLDEASVANRDRIRPL